jgi:hypothetical protein
MSYRFADSLLAGSGRNVLILLASCRTKPVPSWSSSQAVWHILLLCLHLITPDDGKRNCPKHVEFYSKNKFEKLVYLVGFIVRIYHDARSPEQSHSCTTSFAWISWPLFDFLPTGFSFIFCAYHSNGNLIRLQNRVEEDLLLATGFGVQCLFFV